MTALTLACPTRAERDEVFTVSLSAYQTWQQCQQKYQYKHVEYLKPKIKAAAPQLGTVLHRYMQWYYTSVRDGVAPDNAYADALQRLELEEVPKLQARFEAATASKQADLAAAYDLMWPTVQSIVGRYHNQHGHADAYRYEVLLVEQKCELPLVAGIQSKGYVDLILRDRERGIVLLAEHKSTAAVPRSTIRIRDFQTLLYTIKAARLHGIQVDAILWNYLRTKLPEEPKVLQTGKLSRDKSIDTTWDVYHQKVVELGQDPAMYEDVRLRLKDAESTIYFPRYEHVIVADVDLLMGDYINEAQHMRAARMMWESGVSRPVRTFSRGCDWCEFYKLCEAALVGGDEAILKRHFYSTDYED